MSDPRHIEPSGWTDPADDCEDEDETEADGEPEAEFFGERDEWGNWA